MIRNIYIYTCALFVFALFSCERVSKSQSDYRNDLKLFPDYLVDFFPRNLSSAYLTTKSVDVTNGCIFYINYSFGDNDVKKLRMRLEKECKYKYESSDSLLITVKNSSLFEWDERDKIYYKDIKRHNKNYYPIIYFETKELDRIGLDKKNIFKLTNQSGLADNFIIYVYDSKPGIYWKGLKELDYMPTGWENGYSKGVCLNEKEHVVIYWFVIW